jgi:hypothetical protein
LGDVVVFRRAIDKLEAVNRISQLTGSGKEELGPGSKERKRVLINLALGLGIRDPDSYSKHELLEKIVRRFGRPFYSEYISRGGTITLEGLNVILEIGEEELIN